MIDAVMPQRGEDKLSTWTLDNGMQVLVNEDHFAPVVALQVWVKAGAADELDPEAGVAHVHEHMLFKGTSRRGVGEIAAEVEGSGGRINAWTSWDQTVYHLVLASRHAEQGLDILADAVRNSAFDPEELKRELGVVMEEYKRSQDMPGSRVFKAMFAKAFKQHPYGRPVIGTEESITGLDREKILSFFDRFYSPGNMALVIVGDVKARELRSVIDDLFGDFENRPVERPSRATEPAQAGTEFEALHMDVKESHLALGFHVPGANHEDVAALDTLAWILGGGESSRLYRELVAKTQLVNGVNTYAYTPADPGMFVVTASMDDSNLAATLPALLEQITPLLAGPVGADELRRARKNLQTDFIYQRQTVQGQAREAGYLLTVHEDLDFDRRFIERLDSLTLADLQRVARRYLVADNLTVVSLAPTGSEVALDKATAVEAARVLSVAVQSQADEKAEAEARPSAPSRSATRHGSDTEPRLVTLDNGVRIIVQEHHEAPLFSIRAAMRGGLLAESKSDNGVSTFTAEMLTRGAGSLDREQLARQVETMAGELGGFSGRNSLGVSGSFLSASFDEGVDLFLDVLLRPNFPDDEIEKTRHELLQVIDNREDATSHLAFELAWRTVYPSHPFGMTTVGEKETVQAMDKAAIENFYRRALDPTSLVVSVVGDVQSDDVLERLRAALGELEAPADAFVQPPAADAPGVVQKVRKAVPREQSHVVVAWPGVDLHNSDRFALDILDAVLSRQGGRLFRELRDKRGLAYSVTAFHTEGMAPGLFGGYIATDPDNEQPAIDGLLEQLALVRTELVDGDELERARLYLLGSYDIALQTNGAIGDEMLFNELYGLGYLNGRQHAERMNAVTPEDLLRVAQRYLDPEKVTIAVVGP